MPPLWIIGPLIEVLTVGAVILLWSFRLRQIRRQLWSKQVQSSALSSSALTQLTLAAGPPATGASPTGDPVSAVSSPASSSPQMYVANTLSGGVFYTPTSQTEIQKYLSFHNYGPDAYQRSQEIILRDGKLSRDPTPEYERTVDLLLQTIPTYNPQDILQIITAPIGVKLGLLMVYNDTLTREQARAWFQRALELTY